MRLLLKLLALIVFLPLGVNAQWTPKDTIHLGQMDAWELDALGNLYVSNSDLITKYDTSGNVWYKQSIKNFGRIEAIYAINSMRTMVFSIDQQMFMLLDNTLTPVNKTYDLGDLGFGYVSMIAPSSQPNKVWLYDQLNSTLVLFDWARTGQQQRIENVRGILQADEIFYLKESDNNLHVIDVNGKYYVLDRYGALIKQMELGPFENVCVENGLVFLKRKNQWYAGDMIREPTPISGPLGRSDRLRIQRNVAVGQSGQILLKYSKKN